MKTALTMLLSCSTGGPLPSSASGAHASHISAWRPTTSSAKSSPRRVWPIAPSDGPDLISLELPIEDVIDLIELLSEQEEEAERNASAAGNPVVCTYPGLADHVPHAAQPGADLGGESRLDKALGREAVSYTHLTLPTKA